MSTKFVMTLSSILYGVSGVALTFAPDELSTALNLNSDKVSQLLLQIIGGLYFGFCMLNWMTKESLIGGIYNRPVAVANLTHYLIAGLAILKGLTSDNQLPVLFWVAGIIYVVFGLSFGVILFRHPIRSS